MTKLLRRQHLWHTACLLLFLLSLFLRFETADQRGLWLDEAYTRDVVILPTLGEVFQKSANDWAGQTPVLYYALSWIHFQISDNSLLALRLTSVETGILSILVLAGLGALLFNRAVGLVAAMLMAVSVYHINYSQEARPYALLVFLVLLVFLSLFSFLTTGRRRWLVPFVLASTAALYSHHFASVYLMCAAISLCFILFARYRAVRSGETKLPEVSSLIWPLVIAYVTIGVLYLPVLPIFIKFAVQSHPARHTLNLGTQFFSELLGRWGNGREWSAAYALFFLAGVAGVLRRRDMSLSLLLWFSAPFALFALLPFNKFFSIRYLIGALPVFFLLVALGIFDISSLIQRLLTRLSIRPWVGSTAFRNGLAATICIFFVALSMGPYLQFRQTTMRCDHFGWRPELIEKNDGFCMKHLILDSLYSGHSFILKKRDLSEKR